MISNYTSGTFAYTSAGFPAQPRTRTPSPWDDNSSVCRYCNNSDCYIVGFLQPFSAFVEFKNDEWLEIDKKNKCLLMYKNNILMKKFDQETGEVIFFFDGSNLKPFLPTGTRLCVNSSIDWFLKEFDAREYGIYGWHNYDKIWEHHLDIL